MGSLATLLLTLGAELLRGAGDVVRARRVDAILADMPRLTAAETAFYKKALAKLGKRPG
jgi:lipopolysaccharide biosynthesis regulator YciM